MKKLTFLTMVLAIMFIATGNILATDGQVDLYPAYDFNSTEPNKAYVLSIGVNDGQKENPIYTLNNDWNDKISSIRVGKGIKITLIVS